MAVVLTNIHFYSGLLNSYIGIEIDGKLQNIKLTEEEAKQIADLSIKILQPKLKDIQVGRDKR